jgi:uncharacterized membrane protein (DUF373 family)
LPLRERVMESIHTIKRHYLYTDEDEKIRRRLAEILLPAKDELAEEFISYVLSDPKTAEYFQSDAAIEKRRETLKSWFVEILTASLDARLLARLERIGKVHVKIGLRGHYVNSAMNLVRGFCLRHLNSMVEGKEAQGMGLVLNKILDMSLDVMTSSYREEELRKVFLSYQVESGLITWAERFLHGLNLVLMVGLLVMAGGVAALLVSDIYGAMSRGLETGVIKTLGSLLILWIMIELLNTQVEQLQGAKFKVIVFVELGMVAFIRKIFVASLDKPDPVYFSLLLAGFLVMGIVFYLVGKDGERGKK